MRQILLILFFSIFLCEQAFAEGNTFGDISDIAYDATSWDGNKQGATKDTLRDKIETLGAGGGAPTDAKYIVQQADATLTAEQALSALTTGLLKSTTTTGVLSIATEGTDYLGASRIDDTKGDNDTAYMWSTNKIFDQLALKGVPIIFDIGDDGGNDSTNVGEIATSGDTNSIFTEPSADKVLIDVSQNWPTADTANAGDNATGFFSVGELIDARISNTLTASIFVGSGSSTNAVDLATAEVAGTLPEANIHADLMRDAEWTAASITAQGKVELATNAETVTGTDTVRAVTPDGLTDKMAAPGAIGGTTPAAGTFTELTGDSISIGASTNPKLRSLDSDCPGTDKFTGSLSFSYVRGGDGNETAWIYLRCMEDGSNTTQMHYDGNESAWVIPTGKHLKFNTTQWDNDSDKMDGEQIADDTIDDDSIDWADCTFADFDYQTAWRVFYSDASGDVTELALDVNGTYLRSNGADQAPSFTTPSGAGDMLKATYDTNADDDIDDAAIAAAIMRDAEWIAATTTAAGKSELTTTAEVNAGTDTERSVTPDALAGSDLGTKDVCINMIDSDTAVVIADGVIAYTVPASINSMDLVNVVCSVEDKGVTATTDVQIRRRRAGVNADMLSTKITLGDEFFATDEVINASNDDVNTGDQIYADIDTIHSGTAPNGLSCVLEFRLP